MKDLTAMRSAARHSWKAIILPVVIILLGSYTLYQLGFPSESRMSWYDAPLKPDPDNTLPPGCQATSSSGGRYAAVIVETRVEAAMVPIILHFASVLAPWWTIIIFTLEDSWKMPSSSAFRRAVADKKVSVQFLPPGTVLNESGAVSRFFTKPWFWEQLQWAERILFFQSDSILCSQAETTVDAFVDYDYIGAPIDGRYGQGFNGGLSIRNPNLFLRITREVDFEKSGMEFEDQWFYKEAMARVEQGVKLPEPDVAKMFSVETVYYDKPLGYHQPARWQQDHMAEIEAWCPEVKMMLVRRAYREDGW